MKNIFGTQEDLKLYHKNGELAYEFRVVYDNYYSEATFNIQGNMTSYKNSNGDCLVKTYDHQGRVTSFEDSFGNSWEKTYDNQGRETSYKDSLGESWERVYNDDGTYEQTNL